MKNKEFIMLAQQSEQHYRLIMPVRSYLDSEDVVYAYFKDAFSKDRKERTIFLFRKKSLQIIKESPVINSESTVITSLSYRTLKKIQITQPWSEYGKKVTLELEFESGSFVLDSENDSLLPDTGAPHAWAANYSTELKEIYELLSNFDV